MTIKIVFFDIGGVLAEATEAPIYNALNLKTPRDVFGKARKTHWIPYSTGMIDERRFWTNMIRDLDISELGHTPESLSAMAKPVIIEETMEIVRELHGRLDLGIISNHSNEWSDPIIEAGDLRRYFDPIVISSRVGWRKPGAEIFRIALEKAGCNAEEALFIDDKRSNIEMAEMLGMKGILFRNAEELRDELSDINII